MRKYKLAVFIGRFQPYHNGHHSVIQKALEVADNVLVLIGSSYGARTLRNPFNFYERRNMIEDSNDRDGRIRFAPLSDHLYNDELWIKDIQITVHAHCVELNVFNNKVCLIGHSKDNTSYYLKLFPQWDSINVEQEYILSSTEIREAYFGWGKTDFEVPPAVHRHLVHFQSLEDYNQLVAEQTYVENYKARWESSPFPPTFVTVDAVVVQSGHILLVKRKGYPGRGQWALPGGFLNTAEKIEDACIRELREETRIKVPAPVLRGNIKAREVFDDPNRSTRGRTITHAFLIHLPAELELPKVRGSDDAEKAKWFPIADVYRWMMFEDHYDIIFNLTSRI